MIEPAATRRWTPQDGARPEQLMILLHGAGGDANTLAPLAEVLHRAFPRALLLALQAAVAFDEGGGAPGPGRQWFSLQGISEANRPGRIAPVLPALRQAVREAQQASGVGPAATALVGFSQGAILALELSALEDGLVGRVLAFAGRYATLPERAPRYTTIHLFHGADDAVIPAAQARAAMQRLGELQGDATIDIASGVGHALPPVLMDCALQRLRSHIPHRTWAAALGAVHGLAERSAGQDD